MKRQYTFFQKLGFGRPKVGRPQKDDPDIKIYWGDLRKIGTGLAKKSSPEKKFPYTKSEKKLSLATVGGAGLGFAVGGLVGGLGGMIAGVPLGTFAGNLIGRKTIHHTGRKAYFKPSFSKQLFTPREDLIIERRGLNAIERARLKTFKR